MEINYSAISIPNAKSHLSSGLVSIDLSEWRSRRVHDNQKAANAEEEGNVSGKCSEVKVRSCDREKNRRSAAFKSSPSAAHRRDFRSHPRGTQGKISSRVTGPC